MLQENGNPLKVMKFTSEDATTANREKIRLNFDAGLPKELQKDDFDILIATDAISEGYNLNRAGEIFNYDIPYNPTRVIQRIGRINRINKNVFSHLYIFNFFPTEVGEAETRTREISTLKMAMIHAIMGEDTKVLTSDEEVQSFFVERPTLAADSGFFQLEARIHRAFQNFKIYVGVATTFVSGKCSFLLKAEGASTRLRVSKLNTADIRSNKPAS